MCKCGSVVSQTRIMAHLKILGLKTKTCVGIYGSIPVWTVGLQQFLCRWKERGFPGTAAAADGRCTKAFNFYQLLICKFRSVRAQQQRFSFKFVSDKRGWGFACRSHCPLLCARESVHQAQPFPNTRKTYMYKLISISFRSSRAKTNFTRWRCWQIVLYTSPAPTILEWKKTHFKVCTALLVGWSWVGVHGSLFIQFKRANQNSLYSKRAEISITLREKTWRSWDYTSFRTMLQELFFTPSSFS